MGIFKKFLQKKDSQNLGAIHYYGGNSGYVGYSKSKRAVNAEERGLRNKSQMDKDFLNEVNDILLCNGEQKVTLTQIKKNLDHIRADEWHHTSMYGNKTNYYSAETIADYFSTNKQNRAAEQALKKEELLNELANLMQKNFETLTNTNLINNRYLDFNGIKLDIKYLSKGFIYPLDPNNIEIITPYKLEVTGNNFLRSYDYSEFKYLQQYNKLDNNELAAIDTYEKIKNLIPIYNAALKQAAELIPKDLIKAIHEL